MIYYIMIIVFILGYAAIALEHNIHIDKAASALVTGVLVWTLFVFGAESLFHIDFTLSVNEILESGVKMRDGLLHYFQDNPSYSSDTPEIVNHYIVHELEHHVVEIASILFFLIGAMTIVELVDAHEGFAVITDKIKTTKKITLLWMLSLIAFVFSATLDNLTTAIVMAALLRKLIKDKEDIWLFAGVLIIAANAGGAWSPIGDVTTIMLWIGGQVTAANIVLKVIVPSIVCLLVPLIILSFTLKGNINSPDIDEDEQHGGGVSKKERNLIFGLGVGALLFVPVFKTVTHLPPFMGVLLGLGVLWVVTEILHKNKSLQVKKEHSVIGVLSKIDVPSVLFFMGILLAVAALQSAGQLTDLAGWLDVNLKAVFGEKAQIYVLNIIIGLLSSIVDNVPLVAGAMGMYPMTVFPQDHLFWEFLAYCAGTGGSCLIIGSAAGVAMMGLLKIDFFWYLKKISFLALAGYLAGAAVFILMF